VLMTLRRRSGLVPSLRFLESGIVIIIGSFQNRFDIHSRRRIGRLILQRFAKGFKDALRGLSGHCGKRIGFTEHVETFVAFAELIIWNFTKNGGRLVHHWWCFLFDSDVNPFIFILAFKPCDLTRHPLR